MSDVEKKRKEREIEANRRTDAERAERRMQEERERQRERKNQERQRMMDIAVAKQREKRTIDQKETEDKQDARFKELEAQKTMEERIARGLPPTDEWEIV